MSRAKLLTLAVTLLAGAGTASAGDPHPVYRGVSVGFVRIPSGYASPGYGHSYRAPVGYGYAYSAPVTGFAYVAPGYGYGGASYGYGGASYGYGGAYGAAPQGFFFPGGDPFSAIESAINLFKKLREGGLGGADGKEIEKLKTELEKRLDKIEGRLETLEKDWAKGNNPSGLTKRFEDLDKKITEIGNKLDNLYLKNPDLKK